MWQLIVGENVLSLGDNNCRPVLAIEDTGCYHWEPIHVEGKQWEGSQSVLLNNCYTNEKWLLSDCQSFDTYVTFQDCCYQKCTL